MLLKRFKKQIFRCCIEQFELRVKTVPTFISSLLIKCLKNFIDIRWDIRLNQ